MLKLKLAGNKFIDLPVNDDGQGHGSEKTAVKLLVQILKLDRARSEPLPDSTEPTIIQLEGLPESGRTCTLLKLYDEISKTSTRTTPTQKRCYVVYVACTQGHASRRVVYEALQTEYCLPITQIQALQDDCTNGRAELVILLDGPSASSVVSGVYDRWSKHCKAIVFTGDVLSDQQDDRRGIKSVTRTLRLQAMTADVAKSFGLEDDKLMNTCKTPADILRHKALWNRKDQDARNLMQAQHHFRLAVSSADLAADHLDYLVEEVFKEKTTASKVSKLKDMLQKQALLQLLNSYTSLRRAIHRSHLTQSTQYALIEASLEEKFHREIISKPECAEANVDAEACFSFVQRVSVEFMRRGIVFHQGDCMLPLSEVTESSTVDVLDRLLNSTSSDWSHIRLACPMVLSKFMDGRWRFVEQIYVPFLVSRTLISSLTSHELASSAKLTLQITEQVESVLRKCGSTLPMASAADVSSTLAEHYSSLANGLQSEISGRRFDMSAAPATSTWAGTQVLSAYQQLVKMAARVSQLLNPQLLQPAVLEILRPVVETSSIVQQGHPKTFPRYSSHIEVAIKKHETAGFCSSCFHPIPPPCEASTAW